MTIKRLQALVKMPNAFVKKEDHFEKNIVKKLQPSSDLRPKYNNFTKDYPQEKGDGISVEKEFFKRKIKRKKLYTILKKL